MAKDRAKDDVEWYRGKYKELLKENRRLKSRIKQLENKEPIQDEEVIEDSEDTHLPKLATCSECFKGKLEIFEILGRRFSTCNICHDRKKLS